MLQRFPLLALIVALTMAFSAGVAMAAETTAQSTVTVTVPTIIQITGLAAEITLTGDMPGEVTGSDVFRVVTNAPNGATVSGAVGGFDPVLTNAASVDAIADVPRGSTSCTATISVAILETDTPGLHSATLIITATTIP